MAPAGLHDFLTLIEDRPDGEIAHVLAVLTSTAHHIDQQKEQQMAKHNADVDRAYAIARECTEEARGERERQQRHSEYLMGLDDEAFRAALVTDSVDFVGAENLRPESGR